MLTVETKCNKRNYHLHTIYWYLVHSYIGQRTHISMHIHMYIFIYVQYMIGGVYKYNISATHGVNINDARKKSTEKLVNAVAVDSWLT